MSGRVWWQGRVDPRGVRDPADLLKLLRRLRVSAGNPSLAVLSRRTGVPRSTLHDALSPKRSTLPPWELVHKLVLACGADDTQAQRWAGAWRVAAQACDPGAGRLVPRQLPAAPRLFIGREAELRRLDELHASGVRVATIGGVGGIGKTWLALKWAHDNVDSFRDGQLYLDLRGFDPVAEPMPVATAIRSLLDGLSIAPASIPARQQAQLGLYRSVLANRRILLVLDNARDSAQVTPLLPGSAATTVLITSRKRMSALETAHGAGTLELSPFTHEQARELLARHLGQQRPGSPAGELESGAADELLRSCAGLPLALGIVAARAATHPAFPLSMLAQELATARLDALDAGDSAGDKAADIRAVFASSVKALAPAAARMFALLGLTPAGDATVAAAAALAGVAPLRAHAALEDLRRAHLIDEPSAGRFRMHDLLRLYAAECAAESAGTDTALARWVDFFLHTAIGGAVLIDPDRPAVEVDEPAVPPLSFADRAGALDWFDLEQTNLLAAQRISATHGWDRRVWLLAWALNSYTRVRGLFTEELTVLHAGLSAARSLPDDGRSFALAQRYLGRAHIALGQPQEAEPYLREALATYEQHGDPLGQAYTHHLMAWLNSRRGDLPAAIACALNALRLFETLEHPVWTADALNSVGWYLTLAGDPRAVSYCERALRLARAHDYREGEANTLHSLGTIHLRSRRADQALPRFAAAAALYGELGDTFHGAHCQTSIGDSLSQLGEHARARQAWRKALELYRSQSRLTEAAEVEARLSRSPA